MNLQLISANESDIPEIQRLARKIWQKHYPQIVGQAQVDYMLGRFYSTDSLTTQMMDDQDFYFIQSENENCGFVSLSEINPGEYFLNKFYIDTELHGKGLGTRAFHLLLANYTNAEIVKLQVNRFNVKPINFYFKLGFVIEKAADFDIGDGYFMNDFVMVWKRPVV